MMSLTDSIQQL
jgi:hypothetical protein